MAAGPPPRILVTMDTGVTDRRGVPFADARVKQAYVDAVLRAGGAPVLVAPTSDLDAVGALWAVADGLVVTGGAFDLDPGLYGGRTDLRTDAPKPERTALETALLERALDQGRPILAICGGMQLLNVVLGGSLVQDIGAQIEGALEHEQPTSPAVPDHAVTFRDPLAARLGTSTARVNSTHHQAVDRPGRGVEVLAEAPDGVVEAIGLDRRPDVLGVQWHPELLADAVSDRLYGGLVEAAARTRQAM